MVETWNEQARSPWAWIEKGAFSSSISKRARPGSQGLRLKGEREGDVRRRDMRKKDDNAGTFGFVIFLYSTKLNLKLWISRKKRVWYWRLCLAMDRTESNPKSQKILIKINSNILTFYITSIIFYYYSNKKITTKQKISLFLYKTFLLFFSHQLNLLQYRSTSSSSVHCQT